MYMLKKKGHFSEWIVAPNQVNSPEIFFYINVILLQLCRGEKIVSKAVKTFDVSVQYHVELSDDLQSFVLSTHHCRRFRVIFIVFIKKKKKQSPVFHLCAHNWKRVETECFVHLKFSPWLGRLLQITPLKTTWKDASGFLDL